MKVVAVAVAIAIVSGFPMRLQSDPLWSCYISVCIYEDSDPPCSSCPDTLVCQPVYVSRKICWQWHGDPCGEDAVCGVDTFRVYRDETLIATVECPPSCYCHSTPPHTVSGCFRISDSGYNSQECYTYTVKSYLNGDQNGEMSVLAGDC